MSPRACRTFAPQREPRSNDEAHSTHLRVAVVHHDAIAALHRHHRRPVGARGGSLDASSVPPERDARAVAVGRHDHTANTTTLALRAVSDDAPTAVGERLCLEEGRRPRATRWDFFFFQVVRVEFLARKEVAVLRTFLVPQIVFKNTKLPETDDGLFRVYFARYVTPRPLARGRGGRLLLFSIERQIRARVRRGTRGHRRSTFDRDRETCS